MFCQNNFKKDYIDSIILYGISKLFRDSIYNNNYRLQVFYSIFNNIIFMAKVCAITINII